MRILSDGRQRRSREEWQEIIARFQRSGQSENAFCKKHGLNRKAFRTWRARLSEEDQVGTAFVEIPMETSATAPMPTYLEAGSFEIQLPGGVTLRWRA
jgi:transposase-like protein